jgi:hypothetical protein
MPRVMFTFAITHLCLTWELHSSTCAQRRNRKIYTLNSIISTSLMSLLCLYLEALGKGCSWCRCHVFLSYITDVDIKIKHKRIETTHSHCHPLLFIVVIAMLTLCYSIMSHATLIIFYHASMLLTLQKLSFVSHALWFATKCDITEFRVY